MRLFRLTGIALLLGLCLGPVNAVHAQGGPRVEAAPPPEYIFGDQPPAFTLIAQSDAPISEVSLLLRTPDDPRTFVGKAIFTQGETITATYTLDLNRRRLAAFSPVIYRWEIRDRAGQELTTDERTFIYEDNRFAWETISEGPVSVHWYEGERAYAQALLDAATQALKRISQELDAPALAETHLYAYASQGAARAALPTTHLWADSQANPPANVIIVTLPPEAADLATQVEQKIPHEMTHLLLYRLRGDLASALPTWLEEGLAMYYQYSQPPDLAALLANARENETLLPLSVLCEPFPGDQIQAQLAYAQSEAVVRFIHDQYGAQKLNALARAYADGLDCSAGAERALQLPLSELERRWLTGANSLPGNDLSWAPWIILAALALITPIGFWLLAHPQKSPRRVL